MSSLRGIALLLLLMVSCWPAQFPEQSNKTTRALPLNRFPASREGGTDGSGFYFMPTAIGDDYFDGTSSMTRLRRHLAVVRRAGVKYLRCGFSWNGIEKEQGRYDWRFWDNLIALAEANGIQLIPYVAYTPEWAARDTNGFWKQPPRDPKLYADLMFTLATRYRGRIRSWEIWNEPDNKDYWLGTAAEFAGLVMETTTRIREADPSAILVLGGMANGPSQFFQALIRQHHLDRYVDVVAMHAYPESWLNAPAEPIFQQWVPQMHQLIAEDGSGDDLWLNEMGYPDYRFRATQASIYGTDVFYRHEHTRAYQAAMLFKMEVMALASQQISLAGWYRIDDFPLSEKRLGADLVNYHLGVVDWRGRTKPVLFALRFFNRLFGQPSRLLDLPITRPENSQAIVNIFQTKDGKLIVTGWLRSSLRKEITQRTGMLVDRRAETVSAQLPCTGARLTHSYTVEGEVVSTAAQVRDGVLNNMRLSGNRVLVAELRCQTISSASAPR